MQEKIELHPEGHPKKTFVVLFNCEPTATNAQHYQHDGTRGLDSPTATANSASQVRQIQG
jgi:hypothetical protein